MFNSPFLLQSNSIQHLDFNNRNNSSVTSFFEGGTNLFQYYRSIPLDVLTETIAAEFLYITHKNKNVWFADFALASSIR